MAKRRRLSPTPSQGVEAAVLERPVASTAVTAPRAPIAAAAGEAATAAALEEMAGELRAIDAEGRRIEVLALDEVDAEHLMRDRLVVDDEEMAALVASIRAHGQRTPIEVTRAEGGRHGLISGWRRLAALGRLHAETGEARFSRVRALVRRPRDAADAYVSMVEENEIRAGLTHYERARLVARAADAGVFEDEDAALQTLFGAGSAARRSKIKAHVVVHRTLGDALRHPGAIPERLGLALSKALREDPRLGERLCGRLAAARDADGELAVLREAAEGPPAAAPEGAGRARGRPRAGVELAPGVRMAHRGGTITLSGPAVDGALAERLEGWMRGLS